MEVKQYLENYYGNYDEDGRLIRRHSSVEYLTTMRYIDKYIKKSMRVLEVGAATGRYSLALAEQGYQVDALDLVEHNLEILKSKMKEEYKVTARIANALDLSVFEDNVFDITLVLGPLYHLFTKEEKERAISESIRVTKKNGIIFIAYITNDSVILDWGLLAGNLLEGKKKGLLDEKFCCASVPEELFEMSYVAEFDEMMSQFEVEHLHTVAADGMAVHFRKRIEELDEEFFKVWLEYHYSTCERKDLMGYSNHVLYIARKL